VVSSSWSESGPKRPTTTFRSGPRGAEALRQVAGARRRCGREVRDADGRIAVLADDSTSSEVRTVRLPTSSATGPP
jgi:hypothetical protein